MIKSLHPQKVEPTRTSPQTASNEQARVLKIKRESHLILAVPWPSINLVHELSVPILHAPPSRPLALEDVLVLGKERLGQAELLQPRAQLQALHYCLVLGTAHHLQQRPQRNLCFIAYSQLCHSLGHLARTTLFTANSNHLRSIPNLSQSQGVVARWGGMAKGRSGMSCSAALFD